MFLLDKLFGKSKDEAAHTDTHAPSHPQTRPAAAPSAQAEGVVSAPGTHIAYHPDLVSRFQREHHELLRLFTQTRQHAVAGNMAEAGGVLAEFRRALQAHLLSENVQFYVYLEHALVSDTTSHALMRSFRHEMDEIGRAVVAFLGKYRKLGLDPELSATFVEELDAVGRVLAERIRREEDSLYPLYAPMP